MVAAAVATAAAAAWCINRLAALLPRPVCTAIGRARCWPRLPGRPGTRLAAGRRSGERGLSRLAGAGRDGAQGPLRPDGVSRATRLGERGPIADPQAPAAAAQRAASAAFRLPDANPAASAAKPPVECPAAPASDTLQSKWQHSQEEEALLRGRQGASPRPRPRLPAAAQTGRPCRPR